MRRRLAGCARGRSPRAARCLSWRPTSSRADDGLIPDSRVIIEQAKGILAERHGIDLGTAFTLLRGHARQHGQRLADLAAAVINGNTTAIELLPSAPAAKPRK
ncbi:MAG: ANTAR domain-containing protein [Pseudonocardiales bacterium]|nr:ANTAR domain-containing protein [Pseudonocardiales bacterium]